MTLNPSAEIFIPSSQTMRLLKGASSPVDETEKHSTNHQYSPPQLESLYIDCGPRDDEEIPSSRQLPADKLIDYTNFDVSTPRISVRAQSAESPDRNLAATEPLTRDFN